MSVYTRMRVCERLFVCICDPEKMTLLFCIAQIVARDFFLSFLNSITQFDIVMMRRDGVAVVLLLVALAAADSALPLYQQVSDQKDNMQRKRRNAGKGIDFSTERKQQSQDDA